MRMEARLGAHDDGHRRPKIRQEGKKSFRFKIVFEKGVLHVYFAEVDPHWNFVSALDTTSRRRTTSLAHHPKSLIGTSS
jgi:hypothetical protein